MLEKNKRKEHVEQKVKDLLHDLSNENDIKDFMPVIQDSLKNYESSLDVEAILRESHFK